MRRGHPLLQPVRRARQLGYTAVRRAGDYIPWAELLLAALSGDSEGISYALRTVVRRHVNRWVGGAFGKFAYSGRGGFGALLRHLLGL